MSVPDGLLAQCSVDILIQVLALNTAFTNCDVRPAPTRIDCYFACYEDTLCRMFSYNPTTSQCCITAWGNVTQETTSTELGTHVYGVEKAYTADETFCTESTFNYSPTASLCFKVIDALVTWNSARSACENMGASLVKIDSSLKHDVLKQYMDADVVRKHTVHHIGGSKNNPDSEWRWLDGSGLTDGYDGWESGRPGYFGGDCLSMNSGTLLLNHDWIDNLCDVTLPYVCEIVQ